MFFAQFVLAKKGPLAKIWLAAHWEKKLTKAQIYETDVPQAIEEVIRPKVKMALRTVGHLLLGIVRIYLKKTRYLLADTNETYLKMKVNFRDGFSFEADVPLDAEMDEHFENVDDCNITVPEFLEADYNQKLIMANVSRLEDITMKDDCNFEAHFRMNNPVQDDGFGDEDYGMIEQIYGTVQPCSLRPTPQPEIAVEQDRHARRSELSAVEGESVILSEGPENYEAPHVFDEYLDPINLKVENQTMPMNAGPQEMFSSMIQPSEAGNAAPEYDMPMDLDYPVNDTVVAPEARARTPESFALEPLDLDNIEGNNRKKRQRKARKLLVDAETMISNEVFREQQEDYDDILRTVPVAPPTRKMLHLCVTGDLAKLMNMPAQAFRNRELLQEYKSCLVTRQFDPNFTMMEISESSSCASMERPAPWEDLELNDLHVNQVGPVEDDHFFDDIDMGPEPEPEFEFHQTLELENDVSAGQPDPIVELQNKENEEEDWSDAWGTSASSRGRLEAYGFGNSTARKQVDDEGKWSKRANHILKKISADIDTKGSAEFSTVTNSAKDRKQAAEQFYSLLTLVKSQAITVEQAEPYGEIVIRAGENRNEEPESPEASAETSKRTPMKPKCE